MINEADSLNDTASWVLRNKATKEVIAETFDRRKVDALNTEKYEAVSIYEYLQEVNRGNRAQVITQCADCGLQINADRDHTCPQQVARNRRKVNAERA